MIYITKFFWWEGGYYKTIDIMMDCAGFYLCWGCLVWVPSVYTINSTYLAFNPDVETSDAVLLCYLIIGIICIYLNYDIDNQRGWVRAKIVEEGGCDVWGKPCEYIEAKYFAGSDN
jgi:7-dehydrocholesterol reductase